MFSRKEGKKSKYKKIIEVNWVIEIETTENKKSNLFYTSSHWPDVRGFIGWKWSLGRSLRPPVWSNSMLTHIAGCVEWNTYVSLMVGCQVILKLKSSLLCGHTDGFVWGAQRRWCVLSDQTNHVFHLKLDTYIIAHLWLVTSHFLLFLVLFETDSDASFTVPSVFSI